MTEPVNYVTIQCPVSCDISLLLIMWQFNVLYHVTTHNMLSCDKSLYYYLIKYLQTYMSRTKGHNLYIVNLFISWVDKLKCYRILIHTPKARVSNGWENVLESWYTHPRQGFPICGKMCLNLDTPTQDEGFQCVGKCAWILIHPSKTRVSNVWENVFESWYTHPRPGFPMGGKICLNLDAPIQGQGSNGRENVIESWYTHPMPGFLMGGEMCWNFDTPTLGQGFQWRGKCA
jgi:hypothetical protein